MSKKSRTPWLLAIGTLGVGCVVVVAVVVAILVVPAWLAKPAADEITALAVAACAGEGLRPLIALAELVSAKGGCIG